MLNDGPDPVTIAQVQIDEAYWTFTQEPAGPLEHLDRVRLAIPYPWVANETHEVKVLTSNGIPFIHEIAVATETPRPSWRFFAWFALIGLYVGVIPIAVGLLWYPAIGRLGRRGLDFVLALTIGLLVFLFVDTVEDGLEAAGDLAESFQGVVLFTLVALLAFLGIEAFGAWLKTARRRRPRSLGDGAPDRGRASVSTTSARASRSAPPTASARSRWARSSSSASRSTTPPRASPSWPRWSRAAPRSGSSFCSAWSPARPTIAGAWLGGLVYSPLWSVVFLAIAAGAIAQVVILIGRQMAKQRELGALVVSRPVMTGLLAGFAVMYATGLLV